AACGVLVQLWTFGSLPIIGLGLAFSLVPGADKMLTFAFIWVALAVFIVDALYTQRRLRKS
ncbi:EamA family transporter, partial [Klebsiella aerogenes]